MEDSSENDEDQDLRNVRNAEPGGSTIYTVQYSIENGVRVRIPKARAPGARGSVNHYLDCVRLDTRNDGTYGICALAGCSAELKLSVPGDNNTIKYSAFITHLKSAHPEELTKEDLEKSELNGGVKRKRAMSIGAQAANGADPTGAQSTSGERKKALTQQITRLCANGPFPWNIVNNAAFYEFLVEARVIKDATGLPSRATVSRNFQKVYETEFLHPLIKLIETSRPDRVVIINTEKCRFKAKVHISVDGWKSPTGDGYLPLAVGGMREESIFSGQGAGTYKIWKPFTQIVSFSYFNPERQTADSYSDSIKTMLKKVNLTMSDVFSATTDTTSVMPAIFRIDGNKHIHWIGCCQHIGDLVAEDVYKNSSFKEAYDACHSAVVYFSASNKRATILDSAQTINLELNSHLKFWNLLLPVF